MAKRNEEVLSFYYFCQSYKNSVKNINLKKKKQKNLSKKFNIKKTRCS